MVKRRCVVCGKPLPKEGALRKEVKTGKIVPIHFQCAKSPNVTGVFS